MRNNELIIILKSSRNFKIEFLFIAKDVELTVI